MYAQIVEFVRRLFEPASSGPFQRAFLEALLCVQNVSRGSIWVRRGDELECVEAVGDESGRVLGLRLPAARPSVVGWVIDNARMTVAEPLKDPRHFQEVEAGLAVKSRLILGFPLVLLDGAVYGAVELIDVSAGGDGLNLDPDYLELLQTLVAVGGAALGRALEFDRQTRECLDLRRSLSDLRRPGQPVVGRSGAVRQALERATAYGRTDFPVLITGESGTGKELFAQAIHQASRRHDKPYLVQNCSAIPEALLESELFGHRKGAFSGADRDRQGLFEAADGGTVFLDEIGDMAPTLQAKILRLVQSGEVKPLGAPAARTVDVRILSATNKDLGRAMERGEFREDLFYRLSVLPLALPPLRERREDIPDLLEFFVRRDCRRMGVAAKTFSPQALERLGQAPWRGNIRELENLVRYLLTVVEGDRVELDHLPASLTAGPGPVRGRDQEGPGCDPGRVRPGEADRRTADAWDGPVSTAPAQTGSGANGSGAGQGAWALSAGDGAAQPVSDQPRRTNPVPAAGRSVTLRDHTWEDLEKAYMQDLLEAARWNISKAAKLAGVKRSTFDSRLRKLGLTKG